MYSRLRIPNHMPYLVEICWMRFSQTYLHARAFMRSPHRNSASSTLWKNIETFEGYSLPRPSLLLSHGLIRHEHPYEHAFMRSVLQCQTTTKWQTVDRKRIVAYKSTRIQERIRELHAFFWFFCWVKLLFFVSHGFDWIAFSIAMSNNYNMANSGS